MSAQKDSDLCKSMPIAPGTFGRQDCMCRVEHYAARRWEENEAYTRPNTTYLSDAEMTLSMLLCR
jgi:hypothetical protein